MRRIATQGDIGTQRRGDQPRRYALLDKNDMNREQPDFDR